MTRSSLRGAGRFRLIAGLISLTFANACPGADTTTEVGIVGKYAAPDAAPDNLTTTKGDKSLQVTDGDAAPDRPLDQGKVMLTAKSGATATFSGRSTGWGCTFAVNGIIKESAAAQGKGPPRKWTSTFEEKNNARLVLEINEDGPADDVVLLGNSGSKLKIWILDTTGTHTVALSASPADKLSGLPENTTSVTAGDTPTEVTLSGEAGGWVTITANTTIDDQDLSAQITAKVLGFKGKLVPVDDFQGRSYQKLGLRETGDLEVEFAHGTTLHDLAPLTWAKTSGLMTLNPIDPPMGTAKFTAGPKPSDVTLTLTDKDGNSIDMVVAVIPPNAGYCKQREGTNVWHSGEFDGNNFSIGIRTDFYLKPVDVSFSKIWFKEGNCLGEPTGWFKKEGFKTVGHNANQNGWDWMKVAKPEDGVTGSKVIFTHPDFDTAQFAKIPPEFDYGDNIEENISKFNWPIPWLYSVNETTPVEFFIMNQTATVDKEGNATISKGGVTRANRHGDPGKAY